MQGLNGIVVPLVSPLAADDRLDRRGLNRLIEHVIAGGVCGVFILGTTGEGPSLSYRLRGELIDAVCAQVAGRIPVLVGITDTSYAEALGVARRAQKAGAAALVLAPPYYFSQSQEDLLRYVHRVAGEISLQLFLYNIPFLTKTAFEVETVARAAELPGVVGVKDSSGEISYIERVRALTPPEFKILIGPEALLAEGMRAGACGGVCGGANLDPRLLVDLYNAVAEGDTELASRLQERVRTIGDALYSVGEPKSSYLRGLKEALSAKGLCDSTLALPFSAFSAAESNLVRMRLRALEAEA
jgi:4-hydroxy-tetrahydrodipicolinate synthase